MEIASKRERNPLCHGDTRRTTGGEATAGDPATLLLDRTYRHLAADERAVFRRLSVFGAEFDPEAAVAVCGDGVLGATGVLGALAVLDARGLIQRLQSDSEKSRFLRTESVVAYGAERLAECGEVASTHARLVDWIWDHVHRLTHAYMLSREQNEWFVGRVDYLVLAVEWTWNADRDDDRHDLMVVLLANLWIHRGKRQAGKRLVERALSRTPQSPYRSDLLLWGLWFADQDDDPDQYLAIVQDAVVSARATGSDSVLMRALTSLACVYVRVEDDDTARACFAEAIGLARQLDDEFSLSLCSHIYAWFLLGVGEHAEAAAALSATTPHFEQQAEPFHYASYHFVAGVADLAAGVLDTAEAHMRTAVGIFNASGPSCFYPIGGLALIALRRGHPSRCVVLLTAYERLLHEACEATRIPQWWEREMADAGRAAAVRLTTEEFRRAQLTARGYTDQQLISYALDRVDRPLHPEPSALTRREHEVAVLIAQGLINRRIADHLQIAESTVASHTKRIYAKLGIRSRTQLAAWIAARHPSGVPHQVIAPSHPDASSTPGGPAMGGVVLQM
ncbi:LuxR C-terminal-related transcriptional regulator [Streptomyces sp. LN549]|uniref:LuxR C-terminal-related transcriptional regulator n=1 Tax=Streptomyces sp. LN549 TaxID=3112979 RepID=UPI00371E602D